MEKSTLVGGQVIYTHPAYACMGEYCTIHKNSDHHMKEWPQNWRGDVGIMERICSHGVGHPDPDEIKKWPGHGCDGCCVPEKENTMNVDETFFNELVDSLTTKMMVTNGYEKGDFPTEWNPDIKDSQFSILRDMVDTIVGGTLDYIRNYDDEPTEESPQEDDLLAPLPRDKWNKHLLGLNEGPVASHANFFIFMDGGPGHPHTVKDVKEWLRRVEELGIPDTEEVEGTLHLSYDFDSTEVDLIECGDCYQHDIITTTHHCDGRWSERYDAIKKMKESQQET